MRIGIFGGTFDPATIAHREIVKRMFELDLVDKVIVMPTIVNYYRKDKDSMFSYAERKEILTAMFDGMKNVKLDFYEYELADNAKFYHDPFVVRNRRYVDMLQDFIAINDKNREHRFYTIIGGDSIENFKTWTNWQQILKLSTLIVVKRRKQEIKTNLAYIPCVIDDKFADVSATNVRKNLQSMTFVNRRNMVEYLCSLYKMTVDEFNKRSIFEIKDLTFEDFEKTSYENALKLADEHLFKNKNNKIQNEFKNNNQDELIAHTAIFDVFSGKEVEAGFRPVKIKSKDWVTVIVDKDGEFLMEKQLRHGTGKEYEEFPCGIVEDGELPYEAALRELKEETGIKLKFFDLLYLGKFAANPAFMTNHMHYYYIKLKDHERGETNLDEHEHLVSYFVDKQEALNNFIMSEGSAIAGCAWMLLMKNKLI